jgi:uroporphyrin-3 C-methyltransferase
MTSKNTPKRKKKAAAPRKAAAKKPSSRQKIKADEAVKARTEEAPVSVAEAKAEKATVETPAEGGQDKARPQEGAGVKPRPKMPAPAAERQRRTFTGIVAWLALALSIGALTGAGYLVFDHWRTSKSVQDGDAALARLNRTLNATQDSLANLEQRLGSLAARDMASVGELQSLERRLNERLQDLESLPGRVGNLEGAISSLRGISTGVRDAWLLAEAEYYMQIANAQLQLAGNPHLAGLALSYADDRLMQLADPALTEIRRALSDELRSIEVMERPDIEGVTLMLASLASVVDSLPLRQEVDASDEETDEIDPDLSGFDRALALLKRAVGEVVTVRRTDEAIEPLAAPDAVYFLRANLALQLQAARLALLRNEKEIFEQSLDDASIWLARYYDTESAPVQSTLATIAEIRDGLFSVSPPDISESLRLLRQHVTLSGSATPPVAEPD